MLILQNNPSLFNLEEINVLNIKSSVDVINVKTIDEVDKKYDLILLSTVRSNKEVIYIISVISYIKFYKIGEIGKLERSKKIECYFIKNK